MTYQSVWWYPNYIEYGYGLNSPKTWPNVMEQYRKPNPLQDYRYYDIPTEQSEARLYYRLPHLGVPKYRGLFRDKPHTVPKYYPEGWPGDKAKGFHGRMYYEDGLPQFKYEGRKKDDLYWLERSPLLPSFPSPKPPPGRPTAYSGRGLNSLRSNPSEIPTLHSTKNTGSLSHDHASLTTGSDVRESVYKSHYINPTKRMTQDGVGVQRVKERDRSPITLVLHAAEYVVCPQNVI